MRTHATTSKERVLPPGLQVTKNVSFNFETVLSDLRKRYSIIFSQSDGDFAPPIVESIAKILSNKERKLPVDVSMFRTVLRCAITLLSPHYTKKSKGRSVLVLQGYPESDIERILDAITILERRAPIVTTPKQIVIANPKPIKKRRLTCPNIPEDRKPTAQECQKLMDYLYQEAANDPEVADFLKRIG